MFCSFLFLALAAVPLLAETHALTLSQVADLAGRQSPEALLSRLEEQKAAHEVQAAKDPFTPKLYAGSGLAYSSGFPMSIEGSAPSIVQARAVASVYNRSQRMRLAQARETARGAGVQGQIDRETAAARALEVFVDLERYQRLAVAMRSQVGSAQRSEEAMRARVAEGRDIPLEGKRAALEVARSSQRLAAQEALLNATATQLASLLGFPPGDRVLPSEEERKPAAVPMDEQEAVRNAFADNKEIRRLESALLAKTLEIQSHRATRYPTLDLVATYGLFAKFNNYEDFFQRFQRHNGQLGVSVQVPIFAGHASSAMASQGEVDLARLRVELSQARARIQNEAAKAFVDYQVAEGARRVARLDLDVTREQLSVELARLEEGRSTAAQVERARRLEEETWIAYWDALHQVERSRLALLERTGSLLAALR